jgi:hypothetical protein
MLLFRVQNGFCVLLLLLLLQRPLEEPLQLCHCLTVGLGMEAVVAEGVGTVQTSAPLCAL